MLSTVLEGRTREVLQDIKDAYEQALVVVEDPTIRTHLLLCLALYESFLN